MVRGTVYINRLRWRCRRGMRELDVLLLGFLDRHFATAGDGGQAAFQKLLTMSDPEILDLLAGRLRAEDADLAHVIQRLLGTDRTAPG